MKKIILLLFILPYSAVAFKPTPESLFRNASNADINANIVQAEFEIKKISWPSEGGNAAVASELGQKAEFKSASIARFYYLEEGKVKKIANIYTDQNQQSSIHVLGDGSDYKKINSKDSLGTLLWAVFDSLLVNDSKSLITVENKMGGRLQSNKQLLNQEKITLINRYKEYIELINKDKDLEQSLENPFKPDDEERREKVRQVLAQPFYNSSEQVSMEKLGSQLVWKVKDGLIDVSASLDNRELLSVELSGEKNLKIFLDQYLLINGTHSFPKEFIVESQSGRYRIDIKKLRHTNGGMDDFLKKIENIKKANQTTQVPIFTEFLL